MLKLYIYGYLNRIQSSRRLEKESHRNVELMWLLTRLSPDFKTIADFRKDNGKAIKAVCRQVVQMCRKMNMFAESLFAIDGSKFKAVNSKDNNYMTSNEKYRINKIEKSIEEYLAKMDTQVCYNVQTAVDTKHHLIIAHDIGITANVPQTDTSGLAKKGIFNKSLFIYDKDKDVFTCPVGEELPHKRNATDKGIEQKVYVNGKACRDCKIRDKCTTSTTEARKMRRVDKRTDY